MFCVLGISDSRVSQTSRPLPNSRVVSRALTLLSGVLENPSIGLSPISNPLIFQVGQLIDHDITEAPIFSGKLKTKHKDKTNW